MGNLKVSIDDQRKELAKPDDANIENFDEELVPFSGLAVSVPFGKITKPLFFIPTDDNKNNAVGAVREPYAETVIPYMDMAYAIDKNFRTVLSYCNILSDQFKNILMTNINIIFHEGLIKTLMTFTRTSDRKFVMELYTNIIEELYHRSNFYMTMDSILQCFLKKYESNDKNIDTQTLLMENMIDMKSFVTGYAANTAYRLINGVLYSNASVDIDAIINIYNSNGDDIIESLGLDAKYSIATQLLLVKSNTDVLRISEITEGLFIGYFYRITDFLHKAYKDGALEMKRNNTFAPTTHLAF